MPGVLGTHGKSEHILTREMCNGDKGVPTGSTPLSAQLEPFEFWNQD
jgi:hypothetical protein